MPPIATNITGVIKDVRGSPVQGARVEGYEVYEGELPQIQGISDYQSSWSDVKGKFNLVVSPGVYVFVARKRKNSTRLGGQITPEDMSSPPSLPVTFNKNDTIKQNFTVYQLENIGEGFALSSHFNLKLGVYGKLVSQSGNPLPGFVVVANMRKKISKKPSFVSFPTDLDGKYFLPLSKNKNVFYIEVRREIMGKPVMLSSGESLKLIFSGEETYKRVRLTLAE